VDATLPPRRFAYQHRLRETEISKHGSNFTIRKVSKVPMSIMQVIESGTCDYMMAAYPLGSGLSSGCRYSSPERPQRARRRL